jgi:diguanylate cyclase (GGDEF)-like protein/PAS domain S-box-containing protein
MPTNEFQENNYKLSDLIDIDSFAELLDKFFQATKIPNGLVGEDGELLTRAGWLKACTIFHRNNPKTNQYCIDSNLELMNNLHDGEIAFAKCKNGLIDYATPIVIEGQRLATIFLGQVLNEEPELSFFTQHSKKFSYDQSSYLDAISEVPIISHEQMESYMKYLVGMAQILAENGLSKLRQEALQNDLQKTKQERIHLEDILNLSPIGIGWSDEDGNIEYINHRFTEIFGYTLEDLPNLEAWYQKAYPDKEYREKIAMPQYKSLAQAHQKGLPLSNIELNVTCKDGSLKHILFNFAWIGKRRLVNFNDITAHWRSEQRNKAHDSMLEMVAKGSPLPDILHAIILAIESEESTSKCSISLLDKTGKHLRHAASLSLPTYFIEAINQVEIGLGQGSCGSAAYLKERVIVENIFTHEYGKNYKDLAQKANINSCWSEPIISNNNKILGVFTIYHSKSSHPTDADIERIKFAANLAAIAIENRKTHEELETRAYSDYLTGLANRRSFIENSITELSRLRRYGGSISFIMFDIDYFKKINDTYGHNVGDIVLQEIASICKNVLRDIDIIGRIGGEEFAIFLPQTNSSQAIIVAERLRELMASKKISLTDNSSFGFTVSFGVVTMSNPDVTIDFLLHKADEALYQAKANGRNQVCSIPLNVE